MSWVLLYFICGFATLIYAWMCEDWEQFPEIKGTILYLLPVMLVLAWPVLLWRNIARLLHKTSGWGRSR